MATATSTGTDLNSGAFGNDVIRVGLGNDYSDVSDLNDRIYGENGNDSLNGSDGVDTLVGGQGNDDLGAGNGRDTLEGGIGNDRLYSSYQLSRESGIDVDTLYAGKGTDEVWIDVGGEGADRLRMTFGSSTTGVTFSLADQFITAVSVANGASVVNFEVLDFFGGSGTDRVKGGAFGDWLDGGAGQRHAFRCGRQRRPRRRPVPRLGRWRRRPRQLLGFGRSGRGPRRQLHGWGR